MSDFDTQLLREGPVDSTAAFRAADEIKRLRDELRDELYENQRLRSQLVKARALLVRYAPAHDDDCVTETWHGKGPVRCSCGLYEAIAAITDERK